MTEDKKYEPAAASVDMEAIRIRAAQGQFLRGHADLISPWLFHPNVRVQRLAGRTARNWGEATVKAMNEKARE